MGFKFQESLVQTFRDYCENTSLHGFQYLVEPKRSKIEKFAWFLVLVISIVVVVYLFYLMSLEFSQTPTVITLESSNYPIENINFPGIAICDVNRISRKAAMSLAKERYARLNLTQAELFENLQYLGTLYDYSIDDIEKVKLFYRILEAKNDKVSRDYNEILNVMLQLTPQCSETLQKCMWNGKVVECNKIFQIRRTMVGFCCVMNSLRTNEKFYSTANYTYDKAKPINTSILTTSGYEMGLTVLVKSEVKDYYYSLLPIEGLRTFIFEPHEYPDIYSGGLFENFIPLQSEVFLKIEASKIYAVDELGKYSIRERGCILDSDNFEGGKLFDKTHYSYSNCISECKMKSILALCDCVPFFMPVSADFKLSRMVCTLADITCLNKYADKWMTIYPASDDEDLDFERDNSVICDCHPACSYTNYDVSNDYISLIDIGDDWLKGLDPKKHSLLHIYFETESIVLYKTDLYYYWFDQVSNFGGLCGLFLGFSIISIIEFVYFFTVKFIKILFKSRVPNRVDSSTSKITNISIIDQTNFK